MTVVVLSKTRTPRGQRRLRAATVGGAVLIHGLLLLPIAFLAARPPQFVASPSAPIIYMEIEPRPLLPHERPRTPAALPTPSSEQRLAGRSDAAVRSPRPNPDVAAISDRPAPPHPRVARPAPQGTPAPPAGQAADPWRVTPESQAAATARALRTSPVGCRSPELLTRAERVICDERFNARAAEAAARRPITGTGDPARDARFAREGAAALRRYEAKRRPLSGGAGILAPQDCPGSNFGTGCAGAHLNSSMQMDSNRNVQTRREGAPASGRPMTPGAAGPREPMRPQ